MKKITIQSNNKVKMINQIDVPTEQFIRNLCKSYKHIVGADTGRIMY